MESYQGQLRSESDTSEKRRNRASKLTGYGHNKLSQAKYVLENGDQKAKEELIGGKSISKIYLQLNDIKEEKIWSCGAEICTTKNSKTSASFCGLIF